MAFKLQAKHLFLTYSQCELELDVIYNHLINIRTGSAYVRRLCVAQEQHQDEGKHFHVYLEFSDKPCIRNPRFFDIQVYCYIHEVWNADNLSDEAEYTVYDDIDWESFKRQYKSLMGCMQDITVTDKYRSKRNLRYNMPCIVLTNELPHFLPTELDWLNHNVVFI